MTSGLDDMAAYPLRLSREALRTARSYRVRRRARPVAVFALRFFCVFAFAGMAQDPQGAKASERWISLRADKVYGRVGPSREHRILWVYRRRGLPMEVVAETPNWLRLRDPDGDLVWVHVRLTSLRRHVVIASGHGAINLRTRPEPGAPIGSVLRNGVVARLESCEDGWCAVQVDGRRGWVRAAWLQGVSPDETN